MAIEVPLSQGLVTVIDDDDLDLIRAYQWHATRSHDRAHWYARGKQPGGRLIRMHRLLLGALPGQLVDHWNGDSLDNRRANLRVATHSQNRSNMFARRARSGFKGVDLINGRFCARIWHNGPIRIGSYVTAEEAARAYDAAARDLFGEFANLNFA